LIKIWKNKPLFKKLQPLEKQQLLYIEAAAFLKSCCPSALIIVSSEENKGRFLGLKLP